jgi:hypothetical protein
MNRKLLALRIWILVAIAFFILLAAGITLPIGIAIGLLIIGVILMSKS